MPNIAGSIDTDPAGYEMFVANVVWSSGALSVGRSSVNQGAGGGGIANVISKLYLDASMSSPVYGATSTVMPASVETPVALYLGRPAQV